MERKINRVFQAPFSRFYFLDTFLKLVGVFNYPSQRISILLRTRIILDIY